MENECTIEESSLVKSQIPKYYFHVSQKVINNINTIGEKFILQPRNYGCNRALDEPNIARICVGPTVQHCVGAIACCMSEHLNVWVYRTTNKVISYKPKKVADSNITKERWLLNDTEFMLYDIIKTNKEFIQTFPLEFFICGGGASKEDRSEQKEYIKNVEKWLNNNGYEKLTKQVQNVNEPKCKV